VSELGGTRAVLMDLEGTLYGAGESVPGAADAIAALRGGGLEVRFLTNIDSRTPHEIARELVGMGLPVQADHLSTPVTAAAGVIARSPGARVLALMSPALAANLPSVVAEPPYTHVVVGDCREVLDYALLDAGFRAVRSGAALVALQRGRYFKRPDGDHVDTGAVVAALEYAADVTAQVVGKPSVEYFQAAASSAGVDLSACLVIGDDATTDIAGGRAAGAVTVQVRTGKFADQARTGAGEQADVTLDSVADLPALLVGRVRQR
jgi:HAD superfamily hydrolase (TIGR01458 family)